jgi:hypothetical protein
MENTQMIYEWLGYFASVLVVLSLMMSSIIYLRWINLAGAALMSLYGFLIHALPVGFLNLFIVFIDLYYLRRIYFTNDYFSILKIRPNSYYLNEFLAFYKCEITKYIPGFKFDEKEIDVSFFILRNMIPAGIVLGKKTNNSTLEIILDFVIPEYRDFKIGHFLFYKNKDFFRELNVDKVVARTCVPLHIKYLQKMGFVEIGKEGKEIILEKDIKKD